MNDYYVLCAVCVAYDMLYHRQLDLFQFLADVSPLIQEAYSAPTNWKGVGFKPCVSVSLDLEGHMCVTDSTDRPVGC